MSAKTIALYAFTAAILTPAAAFAADKVQIGDQKVFPESITSTADGTLYAGSMPLGQVYKAAPGAEKTELLIDKPAEGPGSVLGVYADEAAKTLWVCYSDPAAFGGKTDALPANVVAYDLATAEKKGSYALDKGSFCNDIATTADGSAYIADTSNGSVMLLKPGASALEVWVKDAKLAGIDGLSFGPDGALYVNSVTANKLLRIDVGADGAAGAITELTTSEPLKGPDGMRFGDDGKLYLAQNGAGRADVVTIEGDNATITKVQDGFKTPTAVTKVGDTLWILDARFADMQAADPGLFYAYAAKLQ
ncbi:SMP-30/gluconolactonase/LRE family protein [Paradevosia shaoguanensis]|uniref:SMP-30/gluconolactonase/LRE family protein n=1 Tax=Paradevosia shaoguanensis TaxID=1335043 RepID=A0AA41UAQ3_9HYPH|nr:SMP-30/gluconolactonase/LRE family protein [Paradevosia shaoguanensis]MCF1742145.1 SMP-30/gluconolactonase/LRE family protein [Paradevosia shaoguanensis]MCI0126628.1 SMP-30/gluconolactonase/LRE family protein [Paradevosia shaoguanensis]